jgi:hypothetical protein
MSPDKGAIIMGGWRERVGSISVDWWATLVAAVITALAVANVLPKVPW